MRSILYRKVGLNFGSAVLAIAAVGALAYWNMQRLAFDTQAVAASQAVLGRIDHVLARWAEAESGRRGFLLTGDYRYLEQSRAAADDVQRDLSRLRANADAPERRAQLQALAPLIGRSTAVSNSRATERARRRAPNAADAAATNATERAAARLRAELASIREDEAELLAAQTRGQSASAARASASTILGVLLAYITAALALLNIKRYVTERERLEERRAELLEREQQARADAEAASRVKSDFLGRMSHEIRTPLNAIGGYVELVEMGVYGPVNHEQRTVLERIVANERHLLGIVNDLLDFTRGENQGVAVRLADVSVDEVMGSVDAMIRPQLDAKRIRYHFPPCGQHVRVRADAAKLRQVLLNLVGNACKFTNEGGEVRVDCIEGTHMVAIRVRDTGRGIPADKLQDVFEPFVQVESGLTRTAAGTGLGLAISRDLVRAMDGDITVESAVRVGSTFIVSLPRAAPAD